MSGPMDPAKLARLRMANEQGACSYSALEVSGLLATIDHHAARADAAELELDKWVSGDESMSAGLRVRLDAAEAKLEVALAGGLRGLLDDAEAERDKYRAKLIGFMGSEGFEAFDNDVPF